MDIFVKLQKIREKEASWSKLPHLTVKQVKPCRLGGDLPKGRGSKSPPPININKTVGHKTSSFQTNYYVINVKYQYRSISTSLYTSMEVPPLEGGGSRTSGTCPMIHHGQPLSNYVRNAKYQYRSISTSLNTSMEVPPLGEGGGFRPKKFTFCIISLP